MSLSLSFDYTPEHGQIHVAVEQARLGAGVGGHRLGLSFNAMATWLPPTGSDALVTALVTGSVEVGQPATRWLSGLEPQVLELRGWPTSGSFDLSLSNDQLIALDRDRGDGDVLLYVRLRLTLLGQSQAGLPTRSQESQYLISRSDWLTMLDQVGAELTLLLRVPSPLTDVPLREGGKDEHLPSLAQAAQRLRQARAQLADGQWEECVATCRRVLENLSLLTPFANPKSTPTEKRTQDQRWAAIYYDLKSMASAAHHDDEITQSFRWTRADAEAVLVATAGLLARSVDRLPVPSGSQPTNPKLGGPARGVAWSMLRRCLSRLNIADVGAHSTSSRSHLYSLVAERASYRGFRYPGLLLNPVDR